MFFSPRIHSACVLFTLMSAAPVVAQTQDWGRKMVDRTDIDFGSVPKNGDVTFKVNLKNVFQESIQVSSLSTSCGCISWQDKAPLTIPSGQTQELTIRLDTVRFSGDRRVTAFLSLVEPTRGSTSSVSIPVHGRIRQDLVLQTNSLNFGQVPQGSAMEIRLNVAYSGGRPDWTITQAKLNNPSLTTKIVERSRVGGTANYDVVVTLAGNAPIGKLRDQMMIVSNDAGDNGSVVSVEAVIEPDIVVSEVQFGQVYPGQPKTINVIVRGKKPFKIEKVERAKQDDHFKVKPTENTSMVHMLPLTINPTVEDGLFEEEFFLTISGREQPVTFKAKGRVMEQSVTVAKPVVQP